MPCLVIALRRQCPKWGPFVISCFQAVPSTGRFSTFTTTAAAAAATTTTTTTTRACHHAGSLRPCKLCCKTHIIALDSPLCLATNVVAKRETLLSATRTDRLRFCQENATRRHEFDNKPNPKCAFSPPPLFNSKPSLHALRSLLIARAHSGTHNQTGNSALHKLCGSHPSSL